jgi:hypothetical protein
MFRRDRTAEDMSLSVESLSPEFRSCENTRPLALLANAETYGSHLASSECAREGRRGQDRRGQTLNGAQGWTLLDKELGRRGA